MWYFAGMCNGVTLVSLLHLFAREWRWLVPGGDLILIIICVALTLWSWMRWKYQDMPELTVDPQVSKPHEQQRTQATKGTHF